jgi:hypothetical protein
MGAILIAVIASAGIYFIADSFNVSERQFDNSEDVFNFNGVLFWAIYFAQVCWEYIESETVVADRTDH